MRRRTPKKKPCFFCKEAQNPDYKEIESLQKFVSERGKIYSRARSGVCVKHQRRLTTAIKRARHLALLPFVANVR